MTTLAALPTHLLQVILSNSGSGGPAAAMTCKALSETWRNALTLISLAARYLLAQYGPLTAARHLYHLCHHSQLLQRASSTEHDGIMVQLLRQLCQGGAEVRPTSSLREARVALHDALLMMQAARAGHTGMVMELVHAAKPSSFALSRALTAAAETGRRDIVRHLLVAGAQPAAYQSAALVGAATSGDSEVVYMLCAAGADPTVDDSRALRRAVQLGHTEAAKILLLYGADARALCSAALLHACELPAPIGEAGAQSRETRSSGARRGTAGDGSLAATPSTAAASGVAAICPSAFPGNDGDQVGSDHEMRVLELVEMLLRAGADARLHGRPSLEAAAARGYTCVVAALLAGGADPAACNSSALVAASIQGHTGVVSMLLESGADPRDVTGLALCTASERGHQPVLRVIHAAQIAASTAEELLLGSSCETAGSIPGGGNGGGGGDGGDGGSGGGCSTPRLVNRLGSSRWSISPSPGAAAVGRWSLHMAMQSGHGMGLLTASGGAAGLFPIEKASLEAFLSNM
ncbi:hypothetical protein VaNZ11_004881 [Volvox africanus]|uniref:F-box domain-containing protein n=1 Tax=Volvox africanus TaxID=51714 RepID=A0ABQ5RXY1_9CHLO|nr:hypothetical protein VaNZ11_004881 [Volvox africanus]